MNRIAFSLLGLLFFCLPTSAQGAGSKSRSVGHGGPSQVVRCGSWVHGPGNAVAVDAARRLAFVGAGGAVHVLSLQDPAHPVVVSEGILSDGLVEGLAYDGARQILFLAVGDAGIEVWDVREPEKARRLSRRALQYAGTQPPARDITVRGTVAYVAGDYAGMHVFDVSVPEQPVLTGVIVPQGRCLAVSWAGNALYTAQGNFLAAGFRLDANGNANFVGSIQGTFATDVVATPNLAYVVSSQGASGGSLTVVDFFSGVAPFIVGSIGTPTPPRAIDLQGTAAFVAVQQGEVRVIELSDPSAPVDVGSVRVTGDVTDLVSAEGLLVANGSPDFQVIDASNPAAPSVLATSSLPGPTYDAWVEGATAVLAQGAAGLRVVRLDAASGPSTLGVAQTPSFAIGVAVEGSLAFVADTFGGLRVFDLRRLPSPIEIASDPAFDYARNVEVSAGHAFVADLMFGLRIDDVSNPLAPVRVADIPTGGRAFDVAVTGGTAFVSGGPPGADGLFVLDVSTPSAASTVGFFQSPGYAVGVAVQGHYAYLADFTKGLRVIDVSDPAAPTEVGSWSDPSHTIAAVAVSGNRAYLASGADGGVTLDITDPKAPTFLRFDPTPEGALNVTRTRSATFLSGANAGLRVFGRCR